MSRILRALLVTATATGVVAVVLSVLNRTAAGPVLPYAEGPEAGPEHLTEEEQRMLMQELDEQL